jgi:hypothetical protein
MAGIADEAIRKLLGHASASSGQTAKRSVNGSASY